jgi:hypothetical protein
MIELSKNNEGIFHIYRPVKIGSKMSRSLFGVPGPKNRLFTIFRSGPGDAPNFGWIFHRVTGAKMGRLSPGYDGDQGRFESLRLVVLGPGA